jgi:hypothetical protein
LVGPLQTAISVGSPVAKFDGGQDVLTICAANV